MPRATLLLRESSSKSLKTIVESAQRSRQQNEEYEIDLRNSQLILNRLKDHSIQKQTSTDEGFESDIDSISLISTDDSFTLTSKGQETDSANGSACSDSDDAETLSPTKSHSQTTTPSNQENFNLVNCVCYTDIKFPNTLIFVLQNETFVFKFDNLDDLQNLHSNFSALKAVANQKTYGTNSTVRKFNLLQRTDSNGVTHIEISRSTPYMPQKFHEADDYEPSSIISISTPDNYIENKYNVKKSLSTENLLDVPGEGALRKVWSSAENLLDIPKKPERRRPKKGPAPPPPIAQNILKGQFVRVNVLKTDQKPKPVQPPPTAMRFQFLKPKLTFQQFKFSEKIVEPWTNSMPRLMKKTRSETRLFPPMAYRYIDTTAPSYIPRYKTANQNRGQPSTISNRLFGMSSKLKEFGSIQSGCNLDNRYQTKDPRYSSMGNLNCSDGTLKSVIKKDDAKRKNDKKVTFSAYNTVQVV